MFTEVVVNGITRWTFPHGYLEWVLDTHNTAILCFLHVDETHRRQGLASAMMSEWAQTLLRNRVWNIELENVLDKNNDFYEKLGFRFKHPFDSTMRGKTVVLLKNVL